MLEHEADKMSLDGLDDSCSSSSPPDARQIPDYDLGDVTDEEDWASIGAAALRQGSYPLSGGLIPANHQRYAQRLDPKSRGRGAAGRPPATTAKSVPTTNRIMYNNRQQQQQQQQHQAAHALMAFSPMLEASDAQDREAVEALLKLSSV